MAGQGDLTHLGLGSRGQKCTGREGNVSIYSAVAGGCVWRGQEQTAWGQILALPLPAVWPWTNHLTPLCLSFPSRKMGRINSPELIVLLAGLNEQMHRENLEQSKTWPAQRKISKAVSYYGLRYYHVRAGGNPASAPCHGWEGGSLCSLGPQKQGGEPCCSQSCVCQSQVSLCVAAVEPWGEHQVCASSVSSPVCWDHSASLWSCCEVVELRVCRV